MRPLPENDLVYFLTILEAIGKTALYSREFSSAIDFFQTDNQLHFNASLLMIAIIGEQIPKISDTTKQKYTNIAWTDIKRMRNCIVHDYKGVDFEITYDIVSKEIPC